jgi:hypothetical protein
MPRHRRDLNDGHHPVAYPFCGEPLGLYIEPDVGGTLVQNCEVCCHPLLVRVLGQGSRRRFFMSRADGTD